MKLTTLLFALWMLGCSKTEVQETTTASGLRYVDQVKGAGAEAKEGLIAAVHYTGWTVREHIDLYEDWSKDASKKPQQFDNSYDRKQPFSFLIGRDRVIKGWHEGVAGMQVGGKRILIIPPHLGYGAGGTGPIPPNATLKFAVELLALREPAQMWSVDAATIRQTKSGLQYAVLTPGTGAQPTAGQKVTVHYSGYLKTGLKFDSSVDRGRPFEFVVGQRQVVKGWDEGIALMKPGGKTRLIIPPHLGYGQQGTGPIPPNATLLFDIELLDAK